MSKKVLTADNLQTIKNVFNQLYMTQEVDVDTETYQVSIYQTGNNIMHLDFFVTSHMWANYDDPFIGDNSGGKNIESYMGVVKDALKQNNYFSEPDKVPNIGALKYLSSQYETAKTSLSEADLKKFFAIIFDALNKFAFSTKFIYQPDTFYSYPHQIDSGIGYFICSYYTDSGSGTVKNTWIDSFDSSTHTGSPETLASSLSIYVKKISKEKIINAALGPSSSSGSGGGDTPSQNADEINYLRWHSAEAQDIWLNIPIPKYAEQRLFNEANALLTQQGLPATISSLQDIVDLYDTMWEDSTYKYAVFSIVLMAIVYGTGHTQMLSYYDDGDGYAQPCVFATTLIPNQQFIQTFTFTILGRTNTITWDILQDSKHNLTIFTKNN